MAIKNTLIGGGVACLIALALVLGFAAPSNGPFFGGRANQAHQGPDQSDTLMDAAEDAQVSEEPVWFDAERAESLRYGMDYDAVRDIVGRAEDDRRSEWDGGVDGYTQPTLTVWHVWKNPDGTKVKLGFISDRLAVIEKENPRHAEGPRP